MFKSTNNTSEIPEETINCKRLVFLESHKDDFKRVTTDTFLCFLFRAKESGNNDRSIHSNDL